jgi:hypothetical protein
VVCLIVCLDHIREVRGVCANLDKYAKEISANELIKDLCERLTLEALAVNDGRSALVVFLLGDPHLLER